jgi:hypothetical protein
VLMRSAPRIALAADRISTRRSGAAMDCDPKALIDALLR